MTATTPGTPPLLGVIGGSGVYDIDGLTEVEWRKVDSPFGAPSDQLMFGRLDGQLVRLSGDLPLLSVERRQGGSDGLREI